VLEVRQAFPTFSRGCNLCPPGAVTAVFIEGALGDLRQQRIPVRLKAGPRSLEILRGAGPVLTRMQPGIEAAGPSPLIDVDRDARRPIAPTRTSSR
jgi:hypothetical protein